MLSFWIITISSSFTFCCLLLFSSSLPTISMAYPTHGSFGPFGNGPLNGLRQGAFFSTFCQPGQQKRMRSQVTLSPAQIDFLCRRFVRGGTLEESAREERATNGGRGGKKLADLVDFDEWADANMGGMMPMAEKRAYDYIRFGRRSVPIEEMMMEKKMIAANKKASSTGGRNTYDYIRFGRRRRR